MSNKKLNTFLNTLDADIQELMHTAHSPNDLENFIEAIQKGCLLKYKKEIHKILTDAKKGGLKDLGQVVYSAVHNHCLNEAENLVAQRYNESIRSK